MKQETWILSQIFIVTLVFFFDNIRQYIGITGLHLFQFDTLRVHNRTKMVFDTCFFGVADWVLTRVQVLSMVPPV